MRTFLDPHEFLLACDAVLAKPEDFTKEEVTTMLEGVVTIIGRLMIASELERQADDELRDTPTEGTA